MNGQVVNSRTGAEEGVESGKRQQKEQAVSSNIRTFLLHLHKQYKLSSPAGEQESQNIVLIYNQVKDHCLRHGVWPFQIPLQRSSPTAVTIYNKECVVISSYNYLGLSGDPRVVEFAKSNAHNFAEVHGTRILSGTTTLHEKLEAEVAKVFNKESALVFSSTYVANVSTIPALVSANDFILVDWLAHKSLLDGCTVSGATVLRFKHNDLSDAKRLYETRIKPNRKSTTNVILVTDSVFSMDGDIFDLPGFHPFCKQNNIMLVVDECHGIGVIGETGRGVEEHFNMPNTVDVFIGTFSKGLGCGGSFVASSKKLISYLQFFGRANVFSNPMSSYHLLSALKALEIFQKEKHRVYQCQQNGNYFREKLKEAGFDIGLSETSIIPVIIGLEKRTFQLFKYMYERGFYVSAVTVPAVALGKSRIRCCALAQHKREHIDAFVETFKQFVKAFPEEEYDYTSLASPTSKL